MDETEKITMDYRIIELENGEIGIAFSNTNIDITNKNQFQKIDILCKTMAAYLYAIGNNISMDKVKVN